MFPAQTSFMEKMYVPSLSISKGLHTLTCPLVFDTRHRQTGGHAGTFEFPHYGEPGTFLLGLHAESEWKRESKIL